MSGKRSNDDTRQQLVTERHTIVIVDGVITITMHGRRGFARQESCTIVRGQVVEEHRALILACPSLPTPDRHLCVPFAPTQLAIARAIVAILDASDPDATAPETPAPETPAARARAARAPAAMPTAASPDRSPDIVSNDGGTRVIAGAPPTHPPPAAASVAPPTEPATPIEPTASPEPARPRESIAPPEPDPESEPEPPPLRGIDLAMPEDGGDWIVFEPLPGTLRLIAPAE